MNEEVSSVVDEDGQAAVRKVQEVIGLFGDPTSTYGIGMEFEFDAPLDLDGAASRLRDMVRRHPHLGRAPEIEVVAGASWDDRREEGLTRAYGDDGRLVRVMVRTDQRRLFVGVHHGVCDGFGMLAVAEVVAQAGLRPHAKGVGAKANPRSFMTAAVVRLFEALFRPPLRVKGRTDPAQTGDWVGLVTCPPLKAGSAEIACAFAQTYDDWPRRRRPGRRPLLVILGVSRREQGTMAPDRRTGYVRLPLRLGESPHEARRRFADIWPEPDFPETRAGGVGPLVTRLLRDRLGATAALSNLGPVTGRDLSWVAVYTAVSGPHSVGFGVVSTPRTTTVTLRVRRSEFTREEHSRLMESMVSALRSMSRDAS